MEKIKDWISHNANRALQFSIGIVYFWFGMLKFFPGLSPAEGLAKDTIHRLTFGLIADNISIILLAVWETVLGILLMADRFPKFSYRILCLHLFCTFTPFFFFNNLSFTQSPYAFTLLGQYIAKNLVFVGAAVVLMANRKDTV